MLRMLAAVAALCALVACRPDTVELTYRYPEGGTFTYTLDARAAATWNIGQAGGGVYHATFDVTEEVLSVEESSAVLEVNMIPRDVEESGLPSPGTTARTFRLRVGPNGEVLEVLQVDGIAAANLDPDQLLFIGTYRPPLPLEPVRLDGSWTSEQSVDLPSAFQQIETRAKLVGFDEDSENELARIRYTGAGPFTGTTQLPQGAAELTGSVRSSSFALFEIDGGSLRSANSSMTGDFDVRVVAAGSRLPITGKMHLELDLEVSEAEPSE